MNIIRKLFFFLNPVYLLVTTVRNFLFDISFFKVTKFDIPIIGIGNLAVGGTGKTPMIEYLINLTTDRFNIATLSRGFGRSTKSFIIADNSSTYKDIGDEPLQFYKKFKNLLVSVDENRVNGVNKLLNIVNPPNLILLDDSFQHRSILPGLSILLTDYQNLYCNDYVLPFGNLRESRSSSNRADVIIVTKSPENLSQIKKKLIIKSLNLKASQKLFFSSIEYSEEVFGLEDSIKFTEFSNQSFKLITGLANPNHLISFLNKNNCNYDHLKFKDHYNYSKSDLKNIRKSEMILTTEKDFVKLSTIFRDRPIYYLPIQIKLHSKEKFDNLILNYCDN